MPIKLTNKEVRIEPTNSCNARCIMCPREKLTRKQGIMGFTLYKNIVDQCASAGAEELSLENFGEPFVDPLIYDRALYAKNKGLSTLTISNGSLFNEQVVDCFDVIRISKYGMSKAVYESIHKNLDFYKTNDNIEWLLSNKGNTKVYIYFLLLEENKHEVDAFIDAYKDRANGISIWKPHNWTNGREYREVNNDRQSCGRPKTGPLQVQWDGKVVPCCFDYNSEMILGDFNEQTLEEILRSPKYDRIRNAHKHGLFSSYPVCNICDQLNKKEDVLIYTNIQDSKVGRTNTGNFTL